MADNVKVSVRHELGKILEALEQVQMKAGELENDFSNMGKGVEEGLKDNTKQTETFISKTRDFTRRLSDQIKSDFKSLASLNALTESLKISNQFKGVVRESFQLSDSIRKLGGTFGIAGKDFSSFQTKLTRGLGDIGLSSEAAANALGGLSETQVRGQDNLLEYSKAAGMLASASNQKGQEGNIAGGMARVLTARGMNPNDIKAMKQVSEDLRKTMIATGKGPTETLRTMEDIFSKMPEDMRKKISTKGLSQLAVAAQISGPGGTDMIQQFIGANPIARQAMEAQGFKGVFTDDGIDVEKFAKASQGILGRVGGDPRLAAKTLGLSDEAAEGFVRLSGSLDRVRKAQDDMNKMTGDLEETYKSSMGFGESFAASINRVKSMLAKPLSFITQTGTDLLSSASQSDAGAAGVVAGGGLLAALLAGAGLKGIGKGLGGGMVGSVVKGAGAAAVTGKDVQPVYVVNAGEIAAGGAAGDLLGKGGGMKGLGGMLGRAGGVAAAVGVGIYGGNKLHEAVQGTEMEKKYLSPFFDSLISMMQEIGVMKKHEIVGPGGGMMSQKMIIELNERQLKASKQPSRGATQ
jgi:ABC-type transporter Mla subunit MlaD